MSLTVLYFLHSPSVLSFYIDVVLTLSTSIGNPIAEVRRTYDRPITTMGFPILVR